MNPAALWMIGTALVWAGYAGAFRALTLLVLPRGGGTFRTIATVAAVSGLALVVGSRLADSRDAGFAPPLMWVVLPGEGWTWVIAAVLTAVFGFRAFLATSAEERRREATRAVGAIAVAALAIWFHSRSGFEFDLLRGRLRLSPAATIGVVVLAIGTVAAMAGYARNLRSRGVARTIVLHTTLLAGCVIFGLPFAWLLLTSFKEAKDIESAEGLVWIPRVQVTAPYRDPKNPVYEGIFDGTVVRGRMVEKRGADVRIDIAEPARYRGRTLVTTTAAIRTVPRDTPISRLADGRRVLVLGPTDGGIRVVPIGGGAETVVRESATTPIREVGLRWRNYTEALEYLPSETRMGLVYLQNTMILVIGSVIGTLVSSALVAYGFARVRFPGRDFLFGVLLATMMLPGAVTMLPTFLIFRGLGWIDTLYPLWVPAFFGSAFNVFMLRQFFLSIPSELEDAAKIDGASYFRSFLSVMVPQIKPALVVVSIWTFMGAWNSFMGPLIYLNSPEKMPLAYALQLFSGDRGSEPGLMMAFATLTMLPVLALFAFTQRYFIEGASLSGLGGR